MVLFSSDEGDEKGVLPFFRLLLGTFLGDTRKVPTFQGSGAAAPTVPRGTNPDSLQLWQKYILYSFISFFFSDMVFFHPFVPIGNLY